MIFDKVQIKVFDQVLIHRLDNIPCTYPNTTSTVLYNSTLILSQPCLYNVTLQPVTLQTRDFKPCANETVLNTATFTTVGGIQDFPRNLDFEGYQSLILQRLSQHSISKATHRAMVKVEENYSFYSLDKINVPLH
jgi:hypothetical protein